MKKLRILCMVVLFVLCGLVCAGCSDNKTSKDIGDIEYTNLKLNTISNLFVGDSHNVEDYLVVSTNKSDVEIECESLDKNILFFIDNTTFICRGEGKTTIKVRSLVKDESYVVASQVVEVEKQPSYYTDFSLDYDNVYASYEYAKADRVVTNAVHAEGTSSFPVLVEFSNEDLVDSYDLTTGEIKYKYALGDCDITVRVPYGRNERKEILYNNHTFTLHIQQFVKTVTISGATSGSLTLKANSTGQFNLNINSGKGCTCEAPVITANTDAITITGTTFSTNRSISQTDENTSPKLHIKYLKGYTEDALPIYDYKDYSLKIIDAPIDFTYTVYDSDNQVVEGVLAPNADYTLYVEGVFDDNAQNGAIDKTYLSVIGINANSITKKGTGINIKFTLNDTTTQLEIAFVYERNIYNDTIYLRKDYSLYIQID